MRLSSRRFADSSSFNRASSMRACASPYVSAARLRMTDLVKRTDTMSASGVISQMQLNARRSTPPLRAGQGVGMGGAGSI
eukprot:358314-Chlamydomonas_euryale.AAC.1